MKAWRVILAAFVIFVAGAVTGALTVRFVYPAPQQHTRSPQNGWSSRQRGDFLERMQRELQLTETQRSNIEQILAESQGEIKQCWESIAPRVSEEYRRSRQRIREQLTPEQAEQFEKHFKQRGSGKGYDGKGENRIRGKEEEKRSTLP